MTLQPYKNQTGFTLIEMIVSLGVFSLIITMAIGSLLILISNNQKLQGEQSVMTNLAFAMDSMTREIRTGYNYYCDSRQNLNGSTNIFSDDVNHDTVLGVSTQDCPAGAFSVNHLYQGVSFFEGGKSIIGTTTPQQRILYFYDAEAATIKRRVGNGDAQSVISSGLEITEAEFVVTGSTPQSGPGTDREQPTITIFIRAEEIGEDKEYELQTTVTQRILDL